MKELVNFLLCRTPSLYQTILKLKAKYNFEKIIFLSLIRDGDIVFDIGANRGYYTLLYSHLVGRSGEVHAFEPVPLTFKKLSEQISQEKRFDNVYLNNTALGDVEDTITLYMPDEDDGQASMKTHCSGSWKNVTNITSYSCPVIKVDDYVTRLPIKRLDFIKLDVEGAELLVLKGATQTISQFLPIVYLEIYHDWIKDFNYSADELIQLLTYLGYSNFYLVSDKVRVLSNLKVELAPENLTDTANLLCTIPEIHQLKIHDLLKV